jgi:hypothetical protein
MSTCCGSKVEILLHTLPEFLNFLKSIFPKEKKDDIRDSYFEERFVVNPIGEMRAQHKGDGAQPSPGVLHQD